MSEFKRYMIFKYCLYYPSGGLCDSDSDESFDTLKEAVDCANSLEWDYVQVFDRIKGNEIDWENYEYEEDNPELEAAAREAIKANVVMDEILKRE